ncbi:MAG TPA: 4-amino-4-deoxy-L-arabinose transferase, partial [Bacteroidales bacterium]|nr:4-amino-4-deoxy-L-arabinose transferase [Bacteroidales bacterium]
MVIILILFPLFGKLDKIPVQLWDESRLAINALEMFENGNLLVTYYKGEPDFWNTKPPLMIWFQSLNFHLFGVNEFSLRLPS